MSDTATTPTPASNALVVGYVIAALGSILFSSKAVMIKLAYGVDEVDALTLITLRMMFAVPIYVVIGAFVLQRKGGLGALPDGRGLISIIGIGLLGYYLASFLDFRGLEYITAQFERLILFTYPFFVMIFGALFFGKPFRRYGLVALAIAYVGLAVIFVRGVETEGSVTIIGALFVLGASISFALYQLLATGWVKRIGSQLFTCLGMSAAGCGAFVHYLIEKGPVMPSVTGEVWALAAALAVLATVLPSFLLNAALGRIGAQATSMIGVISPVATIALAVAILGEAFTIHDAIGTALVIAGVGYFTVMDRKAG